MIKLNLNKLFITLFWIFAFNNIELFSFPGDHNSLTCINNLFTVPNTDFDSFEKFKESLHSEDLAKRAKAFAYVETNKAAIKTKIKASHDLPLDMTVWGDSLSDFVDFYGAVPFDYFGFVPRGDYGNEPGFIDSFGDYFTIFGNSTSNPFGMINYAEAGNTSYSLLGKVNIALDAQREVIPTGSHCIPETGRASNFASAVGGLRSDNFNGKSALRSMVMIGGNDVLQMVHGNWMPFVNRYAVDMTLENISLFVDWNIENGKEVFLLGTIPVYSEPILPISF